MLGAILGLIGMLRIAIWQKAGLYDHGEHWLPVALTVGGALVGIVTFGSLTGEHAGRGVVSLSAELLPRCNAAMQYRA